MSANTSIEWTDRTWSVTRGCSVISPGCVNCYAMKMAHRFSKPGMPFAKLTKSTSSGPQWTGVVRTVPEALLEPLKWRKPQRVFVDSMSDLFHEDVPESFIADVFAVMAMTPQHTYQVLTKRVRRLHVWALDNSTGGHVFHRAQQLDPSGAGAQSGAWPLPNVWLGVSVEDQQRANERIPLLLQTPAAVRFISAEPLLGELRLSGRGWIGCVHPSSEQQTDHSRCSPTLDWVIVGGESGPGARPLDAAWIRSIVHQCQAAGVPAFVKQLGAHVTDRNDAGFEGDKAGGWPMDTQYEAPGHQFQGDPVRVLLRSKKGGEPSEWPADLRVREFPR